MRKRPGNPETAVLVLGIRDFPGADCRAEVPCINLPGPAPQDTAALLVKISLSMRLNIGSSINDLVVDHLHTNALGH